MQYKLRMILEAPLGEKSYEVVMPINMFEAWDRYVNLTPPSEFDAFVGNGTLDSVVERIRKREYRKDDFEKAARQLGRLLGERMEDE